MTRTFSFTLLASLVAGCASATTFSNPTSFTIPAATTQGPATPYSSDITVVGMGLITNLTVTLTGLNHTFPGDVDILLVAPTAQKFILLSDVIGGTDWVGINYTLDDSAAAFVSNTGTPASGAFKPTNYTVCQDPFAAPAPVGPYNSPGGVTGQTQCGTDTLNSTFGGLNPNGVWSLYVVDDANLDAGTMSGGWALDITDTAVPEPSTGLLLGIGIVALGFSARRWAVR